MLLALSKIIPYPGTKLEPFQVVTINGLPNVFIKAPPTSNNDLWVPETDVALDEH